MRIVFGPGVLLESVMARRSEPLPGTLLSARLVTLKTAAGTVRSSSGSRAGKNFRGLMAVGHRRRAEENHMVVSPVTKRSAVERRRRLRRADRAPGRCRAGERLAHRPPLFPASGIRRQELFSKRLQKHISSA